MCPLQSGCSTMSTSRKPSGKLCLVALAVMTLVIVAKAAVDPGDAPTRGKADAPVTLIEFSDYQCPSCGWYMAHVYRRIVSTYVDTGKVRYRVMHFPIPEVHP